MNPRRGKTALELFDSFSKAGKCVGLKLYPSLGYAVDTPEMRKAYKICGNRSLPVLLHCNEGGFRRSVADAKKCDPNAWKAILTDFPKLKVCFGHFGGDQYFVESSIDPGSWAGSILALMRDHPDQVYADIAYHTECMANTTVKQRYQRNLKALLKDPVYGRLILWGSDFFLVRQQLTDRSYIAFYEKLFTTKEFEKLSVANPKRFLGLGDETGANIRRHVNYLNKRKDKISSESSAAWLREFAVEEGLDLASVLAPGNWERNNRAHGALAYFLWARKVQNDAGIPSYIPESLRKQLKTAHPGKDDLFHAIGDLRMGQLSYFLDNPGTGNQLKVAIRVFVTDLQKILLGANWFKAKPAASNLTKTAIFNKLVAVAEKKGATVKNLGNVINKVYRFPQ